MEVFRVFLHLLFKKRMKYLCKSKFCRDLRFKYIVKKTYFGDWFRKIYFFQDKRGIASVEDTFLVFQSDKDVGLCVFSVRGQWRSGWLADTES